MSETILIVDDEESVRRTLQDWLAGSVAATVIAVADAESALRAANSQPIDLAILDWNLGTGSDGLSLLEDLIEFQPDLIAILVTGYAAQATPLEALRKGVRDYLDKNNDLTRETFLKAVRKQLDAIVPAKRQRAFHASLSAFREAVGKVLPLVRGAATLNEPVPLTAAVKSLIRFAQTAIGAKDGILIVRQNGTTQAFDAQGTEVSVDGVEFHRTFAASALSLQVPGSAENLTAHEAVSLFPFEVGRSTLLAIPMTVGSLQVVLELFDKTNFNEDDKRFASVVAEIGSELLRSGLAERQTQRLLVDAVESALAASQDVSTVLEVSPPSDPPPQAVLDTLRRGLDVGIVDAELGLDLLEEVRELAVRHGPAAVQHCLGMVKSLRALLDGLTT